MIVIKMIVINLQFHNIHIQIQFHNNVVCEVFKALQSSAEKNLLRHNYKKKNILQLIEYRAPNSKVPYYSVLISLTTKLEIIIVEE